MGYPYYDYYTKWLSEDKDLSICPDLIKLSSYYSFEEEKPFKDIDSNQNILIVNDVISTGSLIKRLIEGIKHRESDVRGILSIADTRRDAGDIDENVEHPSESFDNDTEGKIISIISSRKNTDFIIEKLKERPNGTEDYKIKRINPILNSIVTLNSKHTEKNKILFENPKDFLAQEELNIDVFEIGHFKQSLLSHSSYYIDMNLLLHNAGGMSLLKECKIKIDKKLNEKCNPFFIFYPVHSGIEQISEDTYHEVFKADRANIIGLQRYQTPLGWRFVFPPKRFNEIIKGQQVLIVDSGTLSGQSLVQLIDAVSIYEVSRIYVLIIIGRLDDFQREFYSRLQTIKVKTKVDNDEDNRREVMPPLSIFFGTNLHIPSYQTDDMCPFCKETDLLSKYLNEYKKSIPREVKEYIENRIEEIKLQDNIKHATPNYIPKDKITGDWDFKNIFLMRDELGKIDGYRFYEDYFSRNNDSEDERLDDLCSQYLNERWGNLFKWENKDDLKKIERVLICILHEHTLVPTIRDLLINLFDILQKIIKHLIDNDNLIVALNYKWSKYSLLRTYHTLCNKIDFYTIDNFELVFRFCENDNSAYNYFSFIIWEGFYDKNNDFFIKESITSILLKMNDSFDILDRKDIYSNNRIGNIIKSIVHRFEITPITNVNDAFFNLRKFFIIQRSDEFHSELHREIGRLMTIIENKNLSHEEISTMLNLSDKIIKKLDKSLWQNLCTIRGCVEKGDKLEYEKLFVHESSIYNSYEQMRNKCIDILNNSEKQTEKEIKIFVKELEYFQVKFLLENTLFAGFCKRFKADLKYCIEVAQKREKVAVKIKNNNLKIQDFNNTNIWVNGHSDLLIHAFEEIFYNAAKCESNKNSNIKFFVKTRKNSVIELTIFQDKPFIENNQRKNGIYKIIYPIFQAFCGDDGIESIAS